MKRIELLDIQNELKIRLNRLACQNPLCFPSKYKIQKFTIARNLNILSGGKDKIGFFNKILNSKNELYSAYSVGMALSDAEQFTDRKINPLPGSFDQKILLGIISLGIKNKECYIDFPSSYAILKILGLQPNKQNYNMLWNSLEKWSKTSILYKRSIRIYNDKKPMSKTIFIPSVLWAAESHWYNDNEEEADKYIRIRFTPEFLKLLGIKFSNISLYKPILKLKGSVSQNLHLYLLGISGYLDNNKIVKRDLISLCVNKLAINENTKVTKMKFYLENAIISINKNTDKKYKIRFGNKNVYFSYE